MKRKIYGFKMFAVSIFIAALPAVAFSQGGYVTGDFHQHTTYTDGSYTMGHIMEMNNKFGLDWWANSEHGGGFATWGIVSGIDLGTSVKFEDTGIALQGKENNGKMWRWQSLSEFSFRDVLLYRRLFPDKVIIQAYEMNVPGHEHASMGILGKQFDKENPHVEELAIFEYLFDNNDTDDSQPLGITTAKNTNRNHAKAVESVKWLQENHRTDSWVIPAHPERYRYTGSTGWNIEHFRDLNTVAPDVFFGFESAPGHQMARNRGEYGDETIRGPYGSYGMGTYGGVGLMSAKVGGLWDALLSEGRHFWLFANSDVHNNEDGAGDFYPGEYQKTYTYVTKKNDPQAIIDGIRSGNSYIVMGDLIDSLYFTIGDVSMGGTYTTDINEVTINIRLRDPQGENHNRYGGIKNPELHHFDLIAGEVGERLPLPSEIPADGITGYSDEYKKDSVETTKVIARFGKTADVEDPNGIPTTAWTEEGNGFIQVSYTLNIEDSKKMYFRLRGTNHALNTPNETDACGNPLPDSLMGPNDAVKAFADLWFYTNPIFVSVVSNNIGSKLKTNEKDNIRVYPNPAQDYVFIEGIEISEIEIFDITGSLLGKYAVNGDKVEISNLKSGTYILSFSTGEQIISKKIVKF